MAKNKGPKVLSVAVAEDKEVLTAVSKAYEEGIVKAYLVGNKEKIEEEAAKINLDLSKFEIIDEKDSVQACRTAVQLVSSGKADVLMKGLIDTAVIMKAVLDKEIGLRTGKLISHVAVFSVPTYHKILIITDADRKSVV